MNTTRRAKAGAASAFALILATVGACGSSSPATSGSAPATQTTTTPAQSAPTSPGTTPSTTPSTAPSTAPSRTTTKPAPRPSTPAPAPTRVVLSRVAYAWHWPNDVARPGSVTHKVGAASELIRIGVGNHPAENGERAFNRMTFAFSGGFPYTYHFEFVNQLLHDGSGNIVPLAGNGILRIVFHAAVAHTADGTASTIVSQPSRHLGLNRMVDYSEAGDFEGYLTYGIGIAWPVAHSNPQFPVRAYEVETVTASGQHLYTVAIDIDATNP